jgi:hypothetical protein
VSATRFPRPVICAWCGNRHRSVVPSNEDRQVQGDGCAASVYQVTEDVIARARARAAARSLRSAPDLNALAKIASFQIGDWIVQGHYGSTSYDCEIYRFVQNPPTEPADSICDNCIGERIVAGDLKRIEGNYP